MNGTDPIIVAHRGVHRVLPENSLASMELALTEGFWVECDVHGSLDAEPIVIHDDTLDRTTEATGHVAEFNADVLRGIRLRGSDQNIPTLDEALRLPGGVGGWIVEIKPPAAGALVRRVVNQLVRSAPWWIVQSFDPQNLIELWSYHPQAAGALLVETPEALEAALRDKCPAVHVRHDLLTTEVRERLRSDGSQVGVWTVNENADIDRVLSLGVDLIITDEPCRVREATGQMKSGKHLQG